MLEKVNSVPELEAIAKQLKIDCLEMGRRTGKAGAHFGGAFSSIEILTVLYHHVMDVYPENPDDEKRDRFILSKGHVAFALYAALKSVGIVSEAELLEFKHDGSIFSVHPSMHVDRGIEFSTGSLGQGLSLGVGSALRLKQIGSPSRTYVLLGDGECDEGSVWEAAMSASHFSLNNLVAIVDENQVQYGGRTDEVMSLGSLAAKWKAFGWDVYEVDGHNMGQLVDTFDRMASIHDCEKPVAVIAHTKKGNGVSYMELDPKWHHNHLTDEQYQIAKEELGA